MKKKIKLKKSFVLLKHISALESLNNGFEVILSEARNAKRAFFFNMNFV